MPPNVTNGIPCRTIDERRKRGVSYPPYMADAKEETPDGRNAALKYRERNEEKRGIISRTINKTNNYAGLNPAQKKKNMKAIEMNQALMEAIKTTEVLGASALEETRALRQLVASANASEYRGG